MIDETIQTFSFALSAIDFEKDTFLLYEVYLKLGT